MIDMGCGRRSKNTRWDGLIPPPTTRPSTLTPQGQTACEPTATRMTYLLEVKDLRKTYRKSVTAVDGISFGIRPGVCFGLLGPNGAGKTTTIEMMEGITDPTSGDVLYKNKPLGKQFSQQTGIQFQSTSLPDFLTVREVLRLFHSFYKKALPV